MKAVSVAIAATVLVAMAAPAFAEKGDRHYPGPAPYAIGTGDAPIPWYINKEGGRDAQAPNAGGSAGGSGGNGGNGGGGGKDKGHDRDKHDRDRDKGHDRDKHDRDDRGGRGGEGD